MTATAKELAARRAPEPKLDAVVVQAVVDLRTALRDLKTLERADPKHMSPTQRGLHPRLVARARAAVHAARIALEQTLEDE